MGWASNFEWVGFVSSFGVGVNFWRVGSILYVGFLGTLRKIGSYFSFSFHGGLSAVTIFYLYFYCYFIMMLYSKGHRDWNMLYCGLPFLRM